MDLTESAEVYPYQVFILALTSCFRMTSVQVSSTTGDVQGFGRGCREVSSISCFLGVSRYVTYRNSERVASVEGGNSRHCRRLSVISKALRRSGQTRRRRPSDWRGQQSFNTLSFMHSIFWHLAFSASPSDPPFVSASPSTSLDLYSSYP